MSDELSDAAGCVDAICVDARAAARALSEVDGPTRSRALRVGAERLRACAESLARANADDVSAAAAARMTVALADRL